MSELSEIIPCHSCGGVGREGKNRECDACDSTGVITPVRSPSLCPVIIDGGLPAISKNCIQSPLLPPTSRHEAGHPTLSLLYLAFTLGTRR